MSAKNCTRNGCEDVFHAFLVKNATYDGSLEIPCIQPDSKVPKRLIPFSKSLRSTDHEAWVHFYEDDAAFERIWRRPGVYLPVLQRFAGVISPDFSLYRDMPLVMQMWNTYRGKAMGHWLQENGVAVIPNIRFADERSYDFCCDGVMPGSVIAIGTHGCVKIRTEREYLRRGVEFVAHRLQPKTVIVYGTAPDDVFRPMLECGTNILQFDSDFSRSRKAVTT